MRFVYSPYYSGSYYVDLKKRKDSLLGFTVCGFKELLAESEMRAGIVYQVLSEPEQLISFHEALNENISGTIFEKSFRGDEVCVPRLLMTWCDSLLMEGWTPETKVQKKDLLPKEGNNKLQKMLGKHGIARQWQRIFNESQRHYLDGKTYKDEVST